MKRKRLLTTDDAVKATKQHAKPCSDCPHARTALHGRLGGSTVEDWLHDLHGDGIILCHTRLGAQCAGAAIYRANVGKLPRDCAALRLPANEVLVFASPPEFVEHHLKPRAVG